MVNLSNVRSQELDPLGTLFRRGNTCRVWIFECGTEIEIRLDPGHGDSLRTPTACNSDLRQPPILGYAVDAMGLDLVVVEAGNGGPTKLDCQPFSF